MSFFGGSGETAGTIWEICIKRQIGKLDFAGSPATACREAGIDFSKVKLGK